MPLKVLVAYWAASTHVQTTHDYLTAIADCTDYDVAYVDVTRDVVMDFDFDAYDVLFHDSSARLCFEGAVSESYRAATRGFRGLKVLAVQDEYDETNRLRQAILDLGFHVVLTCVPQESLDYVYPREEFSQVTFVTVFTGYAPDRAAASRASIKRLRDRRVVVAYRGRDIGARYGRLAFDKYEIGRRMQELCVERGVTHDIAMDAESRIYGLAWFDFVGDCHAMLGTESGSNVFDFDGSIAQKFRELSATLGRPPTYPEFEIAEPMAAVREREISMGQVSPRVFECAILRTPMVLFEGGYSGVITPHEHYIPLAKDFSNAGETLERLRDTDALEALVERAYNHLIASGQFGYNAFWRRIGAIITQKLESLPPRPRTPENSSRPASEASERHPLAERPTRALLGLAYVEARTARGELEARAGEMGQLDEVYRDGIGKSLRYARHLCDILREQLARDAETAEVKAFEVRIVELEGVARGILAEQAAFNAQAEAMRGEARAGEPTEAALPKLRPLVAFYRERATVYETEYQHFDAIYMGIYEALQQAIAEAARKIEREAEECRLEIEREARERPIEGLRARLRAAPRLHRLLRWLRGRDSAA